MRGMTGHANSWMHRADGMRLPSARPGVRDWRSRRPANRMRSTKPWAIASSTIAIAASSRSVRFRSGRTELYYPAKSSREFRKGLRHCSIHLAPDRPHEVGDAVEPFPSPLVEFRRLIVAWCQRIDLVIGPCETQRKPFLALAAEFGEPMRRRYGEWRKLVGQPVGFAEIAGVGHAGLFP